MFLSFQFLHILHNANDDQQKYRDYFITISYIISTIACVQHYYFTFVISINIFFRHYKQQCLNPEITWKLPDDFVSVFADADTGEVVVSVIISKLKISFFYIWNLRVII